MPLPARIVVDVDGTLYDTKPAFSRQFQQRHGIAIAPQAIAEWDFWKEHISLAEFLSLVDEGLHSEFEILGAPPFAGVRAALNAWHRAGSQIYVASDRAQAAAVLTARWLTEQDIPFDALVCAPALDKVAYAQSVGAKLLIDDKPATIRAALAAGLAVGAIIHPYNLAEVALPGVTAAATWPGLRRALEARFR